MRVLLKKTGDACVVGKHCLRTCCLAATAAAIATTTTDYKIKKSDVDNHIYYVNVIQCKHQLHTKMVVVA